MYLMIDYANMDWQVFRVAIYMAHQILIIYHGPKTNYTLLPSNRRGILFSQQRTDQRW